MAKSKWILLTAVLLMSLSSCGIFKKGCGCPHFGKIELPDVRMCKYAGVQMMGLLMLNNKESEIFRTSSHLKQRSSQRS